MEKVYTEFDEGALALGRHNEKVIAHEFERSGIPLIHTTGKNDFDFILPNGQTLEWKIDLRSQNTGRGAIEWPTLQRHADWYGYTFTYARIYSHELLQALYNRGKLPAGGFGPQGYDGRYVPGMGKEGVPMYQFIRDWPRMAA